MKERLTITLDAELLKKIDSSIDGVNVRNRSHAIERLLDVVLAQNTPKKAVVLAGGHTVNVKGQGDIPKPMVLIKGRPILEYVIKELKRNGITEILIVIGKSAEKITSYFGDGSLFGIRLNYIKEDAPNGTSNALNLTRGLVGNGPFFVILGDNLFKINLSEMYKQHITTKALATIALVTADITTGFGVTKLDGFKVTSFVEKPENEKGKLVSAGIYIFNGTIFDFLKKENNVGMIEKNLFPDLSSAGNLYGYVFSTPWCAFEAKNLETSIKKLEKLANSIAEQ